MKQLAEAQRSPARNLVRLRPSLDLAVAILVDENRQRDGPTAHLAVLDVVLLPDRPVHSDFHGLPASGALDDLTVHARGSHGVRTRTVAQMCARGGKPIHLESGCLAHQENRESVLGNKLSA